MIASPYIRFLSTLVFLLLAGVASAQGNVDFGDDSGDWANDGECDDPRFEGDGMASILLDEDRLRDATDCRELFNAGSISLRIDVTGFTATDGINYGDDSSTWAFDGECDDPRFEGDGMASVLVDEDAYADATDCSGLVAQGRIRLRADAGGGGVDFGDDSSTWANDGECDDPRFVGEGMASYLVDADLYRDATDCRDLFNQGQITLVADADEGDVERNRLEPGDDTLSSGEYRDDFTFEGRTGQQAIIDLRSTDFDPYLIVMTPSGEQFDNDDHEGDSTWSKLSLTLPESGRYIVRVTSYEAGEAGAYTISMRGQVANERSAVGDRSLQARVMH